jgi:hypothetical protein
MGKKKTQSRLPNGKTVRPASPSIRDYPDALSSYGRESLSAEAILAEERKKKKIDRVLNRLSEQNRRPAK